MSAIVRVSSVEGANCAVMKCILPTPHTQIWSLSDPNSTGYLDKQGFFMSLRLVGACQQGKDPSLANIALTDPPPRFNGIDPTSLEGRGRWSVDKEEQTRYEQLFQVMAGL